jgi:hypothetical protein
VKVKTLQIRLGKPAQIPEFNEGVAIELGAKILSDLIIATIICAMLAMEYVVHKHLEAKRAVKKQAIKEAEAMALKEMETSLTNAIDISTEKIQHDFKTLFASISCKDKNL